jgi:hypothetical protein
MPDTLRDTRTSSTFLKTMLASHVVKILGEDMGDMGLLLEPASRAMPALLETAAKKCLAAWIQREGRDVVSEDPLYSYLRGKLDSTSLSNYLPVWCFSTSLLCWLNDEHKPEFTSNQVFARVALKRTWLDDMDCLAVMIVNHRHLNANAYLRAISLGQSADEIKKKTLLPSGAGLEEMWRVAQHRGRRPKRTSIK